MCGFILFVGAGDGWIALFWEELGLDGWMDCLVLFIFGESGKVLSVCVCVFVWGRWVGGWIALFCLVLGLGLGGLSFSVCGAGGWGDRIYIYIYTHTKSDCKYAPVGMR